jgi:hypothetical protein
MRTCTWHEIVPLLVFSGFCFAFALMGVAVHIMSFWIKVRDLFCEYSLVAQSVASHGANKSENNQYGFGTWICCQTLDIPVEILLLLCTYV